MVCPVATPLAMIFQDLFAIIYRLEKANFVVLANDGSCFDGQIGYTNFKLYKEGLAKGFWAIQDLLWG